MKTIEIDYCPYEYQEERHLDPARFKVIVGGRRVGKSIFSLQECIRTCLTKPNATVWWVSPTYRNAKEVGFELLTQYLPTLAPVIKTVNYTNLSVIFTNGSKLVFKGCDNEDSLRGKGLDGVVLDECAFIKESVWSKVLRPALADRRGWALFPSTPNGRNWYHQLYKRSRFESTINWSGVLWPTSNNPLIDPTEIEEARNSLSDSDFRQEFLAEFVTKAGMVYDDFSDDNILTDFTIDPSKQSYYLGMDFGFANPTAVCFMAIDNLTGNVTQFDELLVTRTDIEAINGMINDILHNHGLSQSLISYIYTDPAGNAEELSSGISPVDALRKHKWKIINKGSRIAPGLALVRAYIKNANNKIRFFIHDRCINTIRSINGYAYKMSLSTIPTEEPEKDNVHDHLCDAIRYFFVNKFDNAKYVFSELDQKSFGLDNNAKHSIMKRCGKCRRVFPSSTPKTSPPFLCKECSDDN
jgi:hypothetical protein